MLNFALFGNFSLFCVECFYSRSCVRAWYNWGIMNMLLATMNVQLWMAIPFALLLILIAVMPLTPHASKEFWEKYYPHISILLGVIVAVFYCFAIEDGSHAVWHSFKEYVSFIVLVGSLFVISGGIVINLGGETTPRTNVIFLLVGAVLANFIGTTGASMVMIRPWMRMNKYRLSAYHVVFFIFIVSNIGGALTPIGDPPLYIGFLRGVPFFWILEHALMPWILVTAIVLGVFYLIDLYNFRKAGKRAEEVVLKEEENRGEMIFSLRGMKNIVWLMVVIAAVFIPSKVSPETREFMETYFIRELIMFVAAVASYFTTHPLTHKENSFNFAPIKEVGFLFIGIFMTMVPALAYLTAHAQTIGAILTEPWQYFFATGTLSGFLDNTPTYANFFDLIKNLQPGADDAAKVAYMLDPQHHLASGMLIAISLGSVFFGAMTYIGNGPNFMVKSIADSEGVKMPSFFGFIVRYSLVILLPIFIICAIAFLR